MPGRPGASCSWSDQGEGGATVSSCGSLVQTRDEDKTADSLVETDKVDRLVRVAGRVVRPSVRVPRDHPQSRGRGDNLLVLVSRALEVVRLGVRLDRLVRLVGRVVVVELEYDSDRWVERDTRQRQRLVALLDHTPNANISAGASSTRREEREEETHLRSPVVGLHGERRGKAWSMSGIRLQHSNHARPVSGSATDLVFLNLSGRALGRPQVIVRVVPPKLASSDDGVHVLSDEERGGHQQSKREASARAGAESAHAHLRDLAWADDRVEPSADERLVVEDEERVRAQRQHEKKKGEHRPRA